MIDTDAFKERYSDFDNEIVLDILDMFISGYDEYIKALSSSIDNSDLSALKKSTHAFKGIIGNIEADCSAFRELDRIETMSEQLIQPDQIEGIENDEGFRTATSAIGTQFEEFRRSSHQLLVETKKLKLEYQQ